MKVLVLNHAPIGLARGNIDISYMNRLGRLASISEVKVQFPASRVSDTVETLRYLDRSIRGRVGLPPRCGEGFLTQLQEHALRTRRRQLDWEVLYSNGRVPRGNGLGPVVMFDYIHAPQETSNLDAFARDIAAKTKVAERCAAVQVSTEAQRALFIRLGIAADRLHVVPFFMPDLVAADTEAVRAKQARDDHLHIAFVGHQARRKGLPELLLALQDPALAKLPFKLTIVSRFLDGKVMLPDDDRITHYLELPHSEVLALFAKAQVLAVPSRRETFGLVYIEGMASGCVCVMAAGPQQHDISEYGRCGLPLGPNPKALAQTLAKLYAEPKDRVSLALAGLERFRAVYAPARVAAGYAKMFRSAMART